VSDRLDSPPASPQHEEELAASWQMLMGLVLGQRWRWAEVAADLGLSQGGLRALLAVSPVAPRPQKELAVAMNCDPSYVTALVDELERTGYATRRPSATDRRVKVVGLTAGGLTALQQAQTGLFAPPSELARLSSTQQRTLARLLNHALGAD
jgi:DNA-binding MarR family transcriptional regulator